MTLVAIDGIEVLPLLDGQVMPADAPGVVWTVRGITGEDEVLAVFASESNPALAGAAVYERFSQARGCGIPCGLIYSDVGFYCHHSAPSCFVDALAEIMWESIEDAFEGVFPSDPEEYGPLADGHPVGELRNGFMTAAWLT